MRPITGYRIELAWRLLLWTRQWRPNQLRDLALLAGRKLLLADDSITIQKVVDLTFADEGVKVVSVGNGREAIEKLEEINPDVVLADVFMPEVNGYEVCEYIKHTEKLKHIPVMLLVGSFEPFDEAEARRVGADDTLTKPFQSIRKLIDRVGGLVGGPKAQESPERRSEDGPTAELPKTEEFAREPELLSTAELELTTADTQRLPDDLKSLSSETARVAAAQNLAKGTSTGDHIMETSQTHSQEDSASASESDVLLDIGEFGSVDDAIGEEFVLDLDMSEPSETEAAGVAYASTGRSTYVEPQIAETHISDWGEAAHQNIARNDIQDTGTYSPRYSADRQAETQEFARPAYASEASAVFERVTDEPEEQSRDTNPVIEAGASQYSGGLITLDQLAPEAIDAIARRAVELLSKDVVEEIAWEVVPQLSELMIKRQLEQKKN